jgi:DNA polymerase-3 subunit alpha
MDFLGLRNLDVIDGALALIRDRRGVELDIESVALDDPGTYAMLARGDAIGVFQFESSGMREALREVGPTEFADLIALVALYRPGPMAFISTYARNVVNMTIFLCL